MKSYQTLVNCTTLNKHLFDPAWIVIDCRFYLNEENAGYHEYLQSHIVGAKYANLNTDLSSKVVPGKTGRHPLPQPNEIALKFNNWGIDEHSQVVAYDHQNGAIAARLWWLLQWLGHTKAAVLNGGFQTWLDLGLPVNNLIPKISKSRFEIRLQPGMIADRVEVSQISTDRSSILVDSRDPDRYSGENEHIDPVSGHIPGAINIPYKLNITPSGHWKKPEDLKERFQAIKPDEKSTSPVFYCGSGVTACQNILAYQRAGLGQAKLYPGSWSDWILDNRNPVSKGKGP
jgi:thiosulfate/3-mercaptopyruvate sulfurtransferase